MGSLLESVLLRRIHHLDKDCPAVQSQRENAKQNSSVDCWRIFGNNDMNRIYLQVPLLLPASETLKNREIEYSIFVRKEIWMRITNAIEIVGIDLMLNPKS